jgi:hypothetical protein
MLAARLCVYACCAAARSCVYGCCKIMYVVCIWLGVSGRSCMYVFMYGCMHVCVCVYVCCAARSCMYVRVCVCLYVCVPCTCMRDLHVLQKKAIQVPIRKKRSCILDLGKNSHHEYLSPAAGWLCFSASARHCNYPDAERL